MYTLVNLPIKQFDLHHDIVSPLFRYVLYGDVDVDTIAARRLVNFVEKVYGETYDCKLGSDCGTHSHLGVDCCDTHTVLFFALFFFNFALFFSILP